MGAALRPGDPYYAEFVTSSPTTGAAVNADSLPVATANRNGTDDGAFTLTVANLDTGRYKVTGTIPGGYAAGDVLHVSVAATVAGVAAKAVIDGQVLDARRLADVTDGSGRVDVGRWLGTAAVTPNVAGVPVVDTGYFGGRPVSVTAGGYLSTDVEQWRGSQVAGVNVSGCPVVDVGRWLGLTVNALVSGRVDVSVGAYTAGQDPGTLVGAIPVAGQTLVDALRHIGATVAGKVSGAGSGVESFSAFDGSVAVVITVGSDGNRTNVVYA